MFFRTLSDGPYMVWLKLFCLSLEVHNVEWWCHMIWELRQDFKWRSSWICHHGFHDFSKTCGNCRNWPKIITTNTKNRGKPCFKPDLFFNWLAVNEAVGIITFIAMWPCSVRGRVPTVARESCIQSPWWCYTSNWLSWQIARSSKSYAVAIRPITCWCKSYFISFREHLSCSMEVTKINALLPEVSMHSWMGCKSILLFPAFCYYLWQLPSSHWLVAAVMYPYKEYLRPVLLVKRTGM